MTLPPLRPYQQESLDYIRKAGRSFLADEPGLGKSRVLLEASEGRTLVVSAPVLQDTWHEQHQLWRPDLDLTWTAYTRLFKRGEKGKGTKAVKPELLGYDTVIFDEAHEIKNRQALQSIAAIKVAHSTERLFLSTGTPLPNWGHEVFTSLRALYPGDKRFTSYWRWATTWFDIAVENQRGRDVRVVRDLHPLATWDRFAADNGLAGRWIRHERDQVLTDLPPLTIEEIRVPMVPAQRKAYKEFSEDWFTQVGETTLVSWSDGSVWLKLLKLSTGLETEFEGEKGSGKLDLLDQLLAERTGQRTLVWGWFRSTLEASAERARGQGHRAAALHGGNKAQHRQLLADFKQGKVDTLCLSIRMFKEGLTLTEADCAVFVERSAVPSHNEQAMRRIHRLGQTRPCQVIHLVTKGTVDASLVRLLAGKTDQQAKALRAFDLIG